MRHAVPSFLAGDAYERSLVDKAIGACVCVGGGGGGEVFSSPWGGGERAT